MDLEVKSIIPGDMFGVSVESTADRQSKKQEKQAQRQAQRDNKTFDKIRADLIKAAFGTSQRDLHYYEKQKARFEEDLNSGVSRRAPLSNLDDSINVASGALEAENAVKRGMIAKLGSGVVGVLSSMGLGGVVEGVIAPLLAGTVLAPFAGVVAGAGVFAISYAVASYFSKKALKGNRSDSREKEKVAIEEINKFLEGVKKFAEEIERDRELLISAKVNCKNRAEYLKMLSKYVDSKKAVLRNLGMEQYLLSVKQNLEESAKESDFSSQGAALVTA